MRFRGGLRVGLNFIATPSSAIRGCGAGTSLLHLDDGLNMGTFGG